MFSWVKKDNKSLFFSGSLEKLIPESTSTNQSEVSCLGKVKIAKASSLESILWQLPKIPTEQTALSKRRKCPIHTVSQERCSHPHPGTPFSFVTFLHCACIFKRKELENPSPSMLKPFLFHSHHQVNFLRLSGLSVTCPMQAACV